MKSAAKAGKARKPETIDQYLDGLSGEKRAALIRLRKDIREIIPDAEECISYRIPAFRLRGRIVAGFMATAKGCSFLPFSGSTLRTLASELRGYGGTRSSLHGDACEGTPELQGLGVALCEISERLYEVWKGLDVAEFPAE